MKTIAFIDAGQFRPAIVNQRLQVESRKRFDWNRFRSLMDEIAGGPVFDVHYFDCVSDAPSAGREAFHQFLRNTLGFQLHFSELREKRRTCTSCRSTYVEHEQKGVDVGIAVHLLKLAYNHAFDQALLCSGDGDFAPLATDLRNTLGKRLIVVGWHNGVAPSLRDAAFRVCHLEDYQDRILGQAPEPAGGALPPPASSSTAVPSLAPASTLTAAAPPSAVNGGAPSTATSAPPSTFVSPNMKSGAAN